jgi:hypothetical protein
MNGQDTINEEQRDQEERLIRLQEQRSRTAALLNLRGGVTEIAKRAADKLNKMIEEGHTAGAFLIAFILAVIKDFLDIFEIVIPVIGLLLAAVLTYFLWGKAWKLTVKVAITIILWALDMTPFLKVMPWSSLTVVYAWWKVRKRARQAGETLENLKKSTPEQVKEIDRKLSEDGELAYI